MRGGPINTYAIIVLFTYFLVRENEGASARRVDMTVNKVTQKVLWRLSASKTDPRALGAEREWGCLCSEHNTACPYHAAVAHLLLLDAMFPDHHLDSDFPLFPTGAGDFVKDEKMLMVVEAIATRLGERLVAKAGVNRYGKHSWRAMGAVYLTGLRMELYRIQLMARWTSQVIMRYARLSPLSSITDHVRELQTSNSMAKLVDRIRRDVAGVTQQLAQMDTATRKLLDLEVQITDLEEQWASDKRETEYVINEDTNCCHRVLLKTGPPIDWCTPCSFKFGMVRHRFVSAPPAIGYKSLCHRCLPALRAERKAAAVPEGCL